MQHFYLASLICKLFCETFTNEFTEIFGIPTCNKSHRSTRDFQISELTCMFSIIVDHIVIKLQSNIYLN